MAATHTARLHAECIYCHMICLNSNTHLNPFPLNRKDLESKTILPKIFCNMHIARCNMHIAIESILPLTHTHGSSICSYKNIYTNRQTPKHCQKLKKMLEVLPDLQWREQKLLLHRISTVGIVLKFCQRLTQSPPKHHHHGVPFAPPMAYGMGSIDQAYPTQETSSTRVNQGHCCLILYKLSI
jgi:hypothetical protein